MKFKNYLNEEKLSLSTVVDSIIEHCQPFLKDWKEADHKILWSGRKGDNNSIIDFTVRKNRIPRDTPIPIHNLWNESFKKRFGKNLRSESMFCTGDIHTVLDNQYGDPYMVFPRGDYKFYWHEHSTDLYLDLPNLITNISKDNVPIAEDLKWIITQWVLGKIKTFSEYFENNKKSYFYNDNDPDDPIEIGGFTDIEEFLKYNMDQIVKQYKTSNLKESLMSGNEIMINCDKVILLSEKTFGSFIKPELIKRGY